MVVNALGASSDEEIFGAAVFILVFGVAVLKLAAEASKTPDRRRHLKAIATRLHGTFVAEVGWGDRVEFRIDDCPVVLSYHPGYQKEPPSTRIHFGRPSVGLLHLFPEGILASLSKKMFGEQDIEFGDVRFDDAFVVQGSPEAWIREVLDAEARRRILLLPSLGQSLPEGADVRVTAGPAGVTIICGRNLADDSACLDTFIDHALTLYARLGAARPDGVEVLSVEAHVARGDCPVCANPLGAEARGCPRCATPHHSDCWDYFGGCAVYGCGRGQIEKGRGLSGRG